MAANSLSVAEIQTLIKQAEEGPRRTCTWTDIYNHGDLTTVFLVPALSLVDRLGVYNNDWTGAPIIRDGGRVPGLGKLCKERGIKHFRVDWDARLGQIGCSDLSRLTLRDDLYKIVLFEKVEDQRAIASLYPGLLF